MNPTHLAAVTSCGGSVAEWPSSPAAQQQDDSGRHKLAVQGAKRANGEEGVEQIPIRCRTRTQLYPGTQPDAPSKGPGRRWTVLSDKLPTYLLPEVYRFHKREGILIHVQRA